jgi:hypothetical protein
MLVINFRRPGPGLFADFLLASIFLVLLILEVADGTAGWPACRAVGQLRGWVE